MKNINDLLIKLQILFLIHFKKIICDVHFSSQNMNKQLGAKRYWRDYWCQKSGNYEKKASKIFAWMKNNFSVYL